KRVGGSLHAIYPAGRAAADFGITGSDYERDVPRWPENVQAVALFSRLSSQWRVGVSGVVGLDYNLLFPEMDRKGLDREEYDRLFEDIRTMEAAALEEMRRE